MINNHSSFDLSLLSDCSSDTQISAVDDFDASENCTLLLENDGKPIHNGILHRITNYTKRNSRCPREFCKDADDGDNQNNKFYASSRQLHKKPTIKRYLFLFGFISTLIIFSQLYLYCYEPDVEGLITFEISLHIYFLFNCVCNTVYTVQTLFIVHIFPFNHSAI